MKLDFHRAEKPALERIYIAALYLDNFRGRENVEVQLFRPGAAESEIQALKGKNLVAAALPALEGASEDAALACLLEAFTLAEAEKLSAYISERYGQQAQKLVICPMDLPVPLGVGPLAALPEGKNSGFLNFDLAPDYPLDFRFRGYFDLVEA